MGAGSGLNVFSVSRYGDVVTAIPLYANARVYFCNQKWSPFLDVKIGVNNGLNRCIDYWYSNEYYSLNGFLLSGTLGMEYKSFDFGVSAGVFNETYYENNYDRWHSSMMSLMANVAYNFQIKKKPDSRTTDSPKRVDEKSDIWSNFVIRPEVGLGMALDDGLFFDPHVTFAYQFNPYITMGVGVGWNSMPLKGWNRQETISAFAMYASARVYFSDRIWKPFFDLELGMNASVDKSYGFVGNPYSHLDAKYGRFTVSLQGLNLCGILGIQYKNFDLGCLGGILKTHVYEADYKSNNTYYNDEYNPTRLMVGGYVAYNIQFKKK